VARPRAPARPREPGVRADTVTRRVDAPGGRDRAAPPFEPAEREWWPLVWTTTPRAGASAVTVFDVVELRSIVDVLRVAAGLAPARWAGESDADPALRAWRTPVRARHFTQLRAAVTDLAGSAGLAPLPDFKAGPIVAGEREIKLSDLLDLRRWVESCEVARPALAARVARCRADLWDGTGVTAQAHDRHGRLVEVVRVLDGQAYRTSYRYGPDGRLAGLTYPDGESVRLTWRGARLVGAESGPGDRLAVGAPTDDDGGARVVPVEATPSAVRRDGRGRPILFGDPAAPDRRLAYGGDGQLAKLVEGEATVHLVGGHYERTLGRRPEDDRVVRYVVGEDGRRWRLDVAPRRPSVLAPRLPLAPAARGFVGGALPLAPALEPGPTSTGAVNSLTKER
jgi:YD repeat-containing protein